MIWLWFIPLPLGLYCAKVILHYRYYNEIMDKVGNYHFLQRFVKHPRVPETPDSLPNVFFREFFIPDFDPQQNRESYVKTDRLAQLIKVSLYMLYSIIIIEIVGLAIIYR